MKRRIVGAIVVLLLLGAAFLLVEQATAQSMSPTLPWTVMGAGATGASDSEISLNTTLGQPFVGPVVSDQITNQSGFWYGLRTLWHELFLPLVLK